MTIFQDCLISVFTVFSPTHTPTSPCSEVASNLHKVMRFFGPLFAVIITHEVSAQIEAPDTKFAEYLVAPIHVHRLVTKGELNLTTTLEKKDLERIYAKVNRIWGHAGIHFPIQSLTTEAAPTPEIYRQNHQKRQLGWMLALRPKASQSTNQFHIYYLKRFLANGLYIGPGGMFVKDTARLRPTEGGVDEPIPRVTSHELGHALTLKHRQNVTNLLASGTSGWTFNEQEIKQARNAANKTQWIQSAVSILNRADLAFQSGEKAKARELYRLIARIPLHCPETSRARKRANLD